MANSFILPQKGTITKTSQSSINFMKVTCFCQRLLLFGQVTHARIGEFYLAGTAVSAVAACLQDAGRVCGSEFAEPGEGYVGYGKRGCNGSGNEATCGCMIVVSYKYLVILRYQFYLADSTNAIQKHPRFYQDLLCMGNLFDTHWKNQCKAVN